MTYYQLSMPKTAPSQNVASLSTLGTIQPPMSLASLYGDATLPLVPMQQGVSAQEVAQIVATALSSLKVYVVESEITSAQNTIKTIVEQASF